MVDKIIPQQNIRPIPQTCGPVDAPVLKATKIKLGTAAADVVLMQKKLGEEVENAAMESVKGSDINELLQPFSCPEIDETLINKDIEMRFAVKEPTGETKYLWYEGTIESLDTKGKATIKWWCGDAPSVHTLTPGLFNVQKEYSWRLHVPDSDR